MKEPVNNSRVTISPRDDLITRSMVFFTIWAIILTIFAYVYGESRRGIPHQESEVGKSYQSTVTLNQGSATAAPSPTVQRPDDSSAP